MNYNRVIVAGHLTRDIEMRYSTKGTAIANFSVAVNRKWKDQDQEKEEVAFVDCVSFSKQAEVLAKHLGKGSPILIEGRLKTESWEDKQHQKRSKLVVICESFQFLGGERKPTAAPSDGAAQATSAEDDTDSVPF